MTPTLSTLGAVLLSCSIAVAETSAPPAPNATPPVSVNNFYLEGFLKELTTSYEGEEGRWSFELYGVSMLMVTDESADRMRIIAPIVESAQLNEKDLRFLLEVNFERALDAKYTIWRETVWATYVHPLSALTRDEFQGAVRQVSNLHRTWGTSYSSTELFYGTTQEPAPEEEP